MPVWFKVLGVLLTALALATPLVFLAWLSFMGRNSYQCLSTVFSFGCGTPAATLAGFVAAIVIAAGLYVWDKLKRR